MEFLSEFWIHIVCVIIFLVGFDVTLRKIHSFFQTIFLKYKGE